MHVYQRASCHTAFEGGESGAPPRPPPLRRSFTTHDSVHYYRRPSKTTSTSNEQSIPSSFATREQNHQLFDYMASNPNEAPRRAVPTPCVSSSKRGCKRFPSRTRLRPEWALVLHSSAHCKSHTAKAWYSSIVLFKSRTTPPRRRLAPRLQFQASCPGGGIQYLAWPLPQRRGVRKPFGWHAARTTRLRGSRFPRRAWRTTLFSAFATSSTAFPGRRQGPVRRHSGGAR